MLGLVATLALFAGAASPASAGLGSVGLPVVAATTDATTLQLIDRARAAGRLDRETAVLYMAYALVDHARVPAEYRGDQPLDGTVLILRLREELETMAPGPTRLAVQQMLATPDVGSFCLVAATPLPNHVETEHFYVEYDRATLDNSPDGLKIEDFLESLEHVWTTEIDAFGWWSPPLYEVAPPGGKYHVRIDPAVSWPVYGFVTNTGTYAGSVGDNPNSPWDDEDADASCMGLNGDYSLFPGSPRQALDATVAHEFHHSVQYGIGAISGDNAPDLHFTEGSATWMEDEAYDTANDNYNYLWPDFEDDMGEHEGDEYSYWITFRGLTERYGASVPGGGEDLMQRLWELVSRNEAGQLDGLDTALRERGTTLADAYHAYAIAVKFNRACDAVHTYPYCFEEGRQYVDGDETQAGAGETVAHGAIDTAEGTFAGILPDNHSLNWVELPAEGRYRVSLANTAAGGALRLSVVCDTAAGLRMKEASAVAGAGATVLTGQFNTKGCVSRPVAVVTNQAQTGANPDASEDRSYTLSAVPGRGSA